MSSDLRPHSRLAAVRQWLRHHLPSGPSSWSERGLALAFLAAALSLWWFSGSLSALTQGLLWLALVLALVIADRRRWLPLFGSVFVYDLVTATRRGRYAVLRAVYAVGLFLFLVALYRNYTEFARMTSFGSTGLARFAETFCYAFLAGQYAAVGLLTPAYVAGAIAEEKERRTLEFLLATEVRDREIVLGKFAARLANLGLLVLTGLPILSLTQLWGGVDVIFLIAGFSATAATAVCLGGLSLLSSIYCRRARDAVVLTYLTVAGYLGLTVVLQLLLLVPGASTYVLLPSTNPLTVADVVNAINAGNPGLTVYGLQQDLLSGTSLQVALADRARALVTFQLLIALVCLGWAVLRLRAQALQEPRVKAQPRSIARRHWRPRPARHPLLWKELWAEPGLSFNWFGKLIVVLIVLVSLVPALWIGGKFLLDAFHAGGFDSANASSWVQLGQAFNQWVRIVGTLVACLTLLGVAVRAASSISGERDRQTFDTLLTAPVTSNDLLYTRWLGAILSVRWAWAWLALVWLVGAMGDGLFAPSVCWLVLAWFVYAAFLSMLGLWFSMTSRTTLRATVATLLTAAVLGVGHWYLWLVFCLPLSIQADWVGTWLRFQMLALTPPMAFGWLAFRGNDVGGAPGQVSQDPMADFVCLLLGLVLWALATGALWLVASRRFRRLTGRVELKPPGPPPALLEGKPAVAPRPPRRRRRLLTAAVVLLGLLIGGAIYLAVRADRHLDASLAETDRRDPGWRLADIEAARPPVPDDRNAGLTVLTARAMVPWPGWPSPEGQQLVENPHPEVRLTPQQYQAMIAELENAESALWEIRTLADLPEGRYQIQWSRDYCSTLLRHLDACYAIHEMLRFDIAIRAEEGDPDRALTSCRRLLNLARSVGDEPLLVSQLQRLWRGRDAVHMAERVLAQGEPSQAALIQLQRALEQEEPHRGLLIGARGERATMDGFFALLDTGEVAWSPYRRWLGSEMDTPEKAGEAFLASVVPGSEREARAALLDHMNRFVDAAALPVEDQAAALAGMEAERQRLPFLAREFAPRWASLSDRFPVGKAELRCAAAALAAERFRRERGRWPEGLDELVPDFLASIPLDPYSKGRLCYRRLEDGVVIYSLGVNRADDGGDLSGNPRDTKSPDLGFRLWDVSKRRQGPP